MIRFLIVALLTALLAGCGGGGDGGAGSAVLGAAGQSVAAPDASSSKGQDGTNASKPAEDASWSKLAEDASLCTVEIYGDSIMAFNGTAQIPSMTLQLFRPNLKVVADHAVLGMSLDVLARSFAGLGRSAHYVIIENGVIDAWQGENINKVISDYYAIIQQVRAEGRVPVLTGFSRQAKGGPLNHVQLLLRDYYDDVIKSIATKTNTAFADWGSVPFFGAWDLVDFVHPNKNYSDRLIWRLALTLDTLATNCTSTLVPPR